MRPDYLRSWIAKPDRILPYTGMPENIKYQSDSPTLGGVSQNLYHGTSIDQLDGLVDLLMNFDQYARRRSPIAPLVQSAAPAADAEGGEADTNPAGAIPADENPPEANPAGGNVGVETGGP